MPFRVLVFFVIAWVVGATATWADDQNGVEAAVEEQAPNSNKTIESVATVLELVFTFDETSAKECLGILTKKAQNREIAAESLATLRQRIGEKLAAAIEKPRHALHAEASFLAAAWGDPTAVQACKTIALDRGNADTGRAAAFEALALSGSNESLSLAGSIFNSQPSADLSGFVLAILGRLPHAEIADLVLNAYPTFHPDAQPKAIELLTQRAAWREALLDRVEQAKLPKDILNTNQVARLASDDREPFRARVAKLWGAIRTERNPERERVVSEMRTFLNRTAGDEVRGAEVFQRVCGQCHKIYGKGQEVGPEITLNGRASFEQLLSNVFDPSLVIGAAYQPRTVVTNEGRVITGLLAEDNDQRVVLKLQGGKIETIPRDEIDELEVSKLSLMPEGLERQLSAPDIADLFAYICLVVDPNTHDSTWIPGSPALMAADAPSIPGKIESGWRLIGRTNRILAVPEERGLVIRDLGEVVGLERDVAAHSPASELTIAFDQEVEAQLYVDGALVEWIKLPTGDPNPEEPSSLSRRFRAIVPSGSEKPIRVSVLFRRDQAKASEPLTITEMK